MNVSVFLFCANSSISVARAISPSRRREQPAPQHDARRGAPANTRQPMARTQSCNRAQSAFHRLAMKGAKVTTAERCRADSKARGARRRERRKYGSVGHGCARRAARLQRTVRTSERAGRAPTPPATRQPARRGRSPCSPCSASATSMPLQSHHTLLPRVVLWGPVPGDDIDIPEQHEREMVCVWPLVKP